MIALVGFAVGYVVGTRAGREGLERLLQAGQSIVASEEFRALLDSGKMTLNTAVRGQMEAMTGDGHQGRRQIGPRVA